MVQKEMVLWKSCTVLIFFFSFKICFQVQSLAFSQFISGIERESKTISLHTQ